jgi:hypothetical protein
MKSPARGGAFGSLVHVAVQRHAMFAVSRVTPPSRSNAVRKFVICSGRDSLISVTIVAYPVHFAGVSVDHLQAWASVVSAAMGAVALGLVAWQIKQARTTIQGSTNARLMSESLEILRFLADHPENYDYFYKCKSPHEAPSETLKCIAEMFSNYMEHVVQQLTTMPKPERAYWSKFVKDTYARSPVIRKHLKDFKDWYDPRLHKLVEGVGPVEPG